MFFLDIVVLVFICVVSDKIFLFSEQTTKMISLEDFPILILEVILKYVDLNDKKNLRLTCSTLAFRIISIGRY